ncbi:MAG: peptidoglycan bridge formation glycyltransferase FemA/FemB family protein [Bacteroidia bacterium]
MKSLKEYKSTNENFPYFYFSAYSEFIKKTENKTIVFISDEIGNTMCCSMWKNKFLNLIKPVYPPLNKNAERLSPEMEIFFLEECLLFIKEEKLGDRITQPENFAIFDSAPQSSVFSKFGTYFINLARETEEQLLKNVHTKHRNVIVNAEKNNVVIKYGKEVIEDFYLLYKSTMQRSAMYCQALNYFQDFYSAMPDNIICGVAYHNDIPQGGLFVPYTKFAAFYLYGASADKVEVNGAINYLHWNTIKFLKKQNVKRYDFVGARLSDVSGTKLQGIQQFKERFGASLQKGYLWKKDINTLKCNLFDNLITLKLKLKKAYLPTDIIDQEINKEKNL